MRSFTRKPHIKKDIWCARLFIKSKGKCFARVNRAVERHEMRRRRLVNSLESLWLCSSHDLIQASIRRLWLEDSFTRSTENTFSDFFSFASFPFSFMNRQVGTKQMMVKKKRDKWLLVLRHPRECRLLKRKFPPVDDRKTEKISLLGFSCGRFEESFSDTISKSE